jgi:hypothetical protein
MLKKNILKVWDAFQISENKCAQIIIEGDTAEGVKVYERRNTFQ